MTDKELLKLAAKAAGFKLEQGYGQPPEKCLFYVDSEGCCRDWNPLDDDRDALRLAVKLGIGVQSFASIGHSHAGSEQITRSIVIKEQHRSDPYAATRRAIVRAAAEIGKTLKD